MAAAACHVGGFDARFVEPLDKDLECPVCLLALRDPLQVGTCGHLFCESCLDEITKDGKFKCPLDNKESFRKDAFSDLFHQRKVLNLKVRCSNSLKGCKWSGDLRQLERHMTGIGMTQCDFMEMECRFSGVGCEVKVKKTDMKSHLTSHVEEHTLLLLSGYEALKQENEDLKAQLRDRSPKNCVFLWKIEKWSEKRETAKEGTGEGVFFSSSFYTGYPGYKLGVQVFPNGKGEGRGTHVSVFLAVFRGKYDAMLPWPFSCPYILTLVDQQPQGRHHSERVLPAIEDQSVQEIYFKRPNSNRNISWGIPKFIEQSAIDSAAFVQDDCIVIKAEVEL